MRKTLLFVRIVVTWSLQVEHAVEPSVPFLADWPKFGFAHAPRTPWMPAARPGSTMFRRAHRAARAATPVHAAQGNGVLAKPIPSKAITPTPLSSPAGAEDSTEEIFGPDAPWQLPASPWFKMDTIAPPRHETINLDLHPRERWVEVMEKYKDEIIPYFDQWEKILQHHTEIDAEIWVKTFEDRASHTYLDELHGIFDTLNKGLNASNVTWNNLVLFQMQYELGSPIACSQILAATPDGTVLHGRNLDYRLVSPLLEITFMRHGKPAIVGATFLGGIGLHTGLRPGHWSFGTNTRIEFGDSAEDRLMRAVKGSWTYAMLLRKLSEKHLTFDELVAKLRSTPMIRGTYVLVAGPGPYQGINIVRSPNPSFRYVEELSPVGKWFIVQTNDDSFLPPKDGRRDSGISAMKDLTQRNVDPTSMMTIMHSPPLLAPGNIVLFISSPKSGRSCMILGKRAGGSDAVCNMEDWTSALPGVEPLWADWFQYKID